ncbi:MAG: FtsX-like permease family protein [Eubacterium sp.]|nr:FtsX-like permease family protein [Eubacterium sp.]
MITFFLIMVLATVMLHTGLAIFNGYNGLHESKKDQYNFADVVVESTLRPEDKAKIEEIISNSEFIESYEKQNPVVESFEMTKAGSEEDSKNMYDLSSFDLALLPYGEWGEIEAPHFVELSEEEFDNPIYLSYYINTNFIKADLGESIDVKMGDRYYTFQVAGIYESLISSETGVTYISPSLYNELKTEKESKLLEAQKNNDMQTDTLEYSRTIFYMKTVPGYDLQDATGKLTKSFSEHEILAFAIGADLVITDLTYMENMIAAMLAAFALIITVISMIIIYFRVSNSIEQNIVNIGALKSLGYTSRQIRASMVIEFTLTTFLAVISGVVLSYVILFPFEKMMRSFSGVQWVISFDLISFLITCILIVGTVILVSIRSTKMIGKLDPVVALRFGINTHSFKKNHAPIETTHGPLTWIMALKSVLSNTKQNIILIVVMLSIGIVTTFSAFLAYNCVYNSSYLYRMVNLIGTDVDLRFSEDMNVIDEIAELPYVESVWWMDAVSTTVEGYSVQATITDDFSDIGEINVYEGRCPKYDNEIVLGGSLAKTLGVDIGDEVNVSYGQKERKYLITGFEQSGANNGMDLSITSEGIEHLGYKPVKTSIGVFVKNHSLENTKRLVDDAQSMYGDKLISYGNAIETLKSGDESIIAIASIMIGVMVLISIFVIVLSLNLLVKTTIIKKQQEIGIKKAIGFSSDQLRTELVLSMMPQIFIGALVGSLLGYKWSNAILATLLSAIGIMRSNMVMFPWMIIVSVLFGLIVSFVIIWFISGRIRKISAYSLITE